MSVNQNQGGIVGDNPVVGVVILEIIEGLMFASVRSRHSELDLSPGSGTDLMQALQNGRGKQRPEGFLHGLYDRG